MESFASASASSSESNSQIGQHGTEDLVAKRRHLGRHVRENGRPHEIAVRRATLTRLHQPRAARRRSTPAESRHRCPRAASGPRPVPCRSIRRIPSPTVIAFARATSASRNGDAMSALQQDAAGRRAPLAGIREYPAVIGRIEGQLEIGIVHHDQRVLAAELELRPREVRCRARLNLLADCSRSRERHCADARIVDDARCRSTIQGR